MTTSREARLTNPRLLRLAYVPALLALVLVMFSLEGVPAAIEPVTPTGTFDGEAAARAAREIARLGARPPGSAADGEAADLVRRSFNQAPAGAVSEQTFEAEVDGEATTLRNVLVTLPGDGSGLVVIAADRSSNGPGEATSAAAGGVLTELARALGVGHRSTYLLASTTGGAHGLEALLAGLSEPELVDSVIVIEQPGAEEPRAPYAVTSSLDTASGPLQLRETAEGVIETQAGIVSPGQSAFGQLARLAFPSGIGGQAALISDGYEAIAISSHGERRLGDDQPASAETIDAFGRSAFSLLDAIDLAGSLEPGRDTYIESGENLIPGWTLAALALALLLPGLLASIDGCARASRRGARLVAALLWAGARCLPFVGALAALYGLALGGLIPRPGFPFDPASFEPGARSSIAFGLIALALALSAYLLRRLGVTGRTAPPGSIAAAGLIIALATLALWLANPYLALLAAPAANVWVLADAPATRRRAALVLTAVVASLIPPAAALGSVSGALELGGNAPWIFTLMLADGQIPFAATLAGAVIAGGLIGALALALGGGGRMPAAPGAGERDPAGASGEAAIPASS